MWIKKEIKDLIRVRDMSEKRQGMFRMDRNERTLAFSDEIVSKIRESVTSEIFTNYPEIAPLYDKMAQYLGIRTENLIFHTGSDLVIKSIYETYVSRGDKVLIQKPAYAMYSVYAEMFQAESIVQQYDVNWRFDLEEYQEKLVSEKPKLAVLENPNGSIGNCYSHQQVESFVKTAARTNTLAIIDEAYIDFCGGSVIDLIDKYNNLIVVRTMSKAWGMAGLRVGYAVSNKDVINDLFQVKPMHQLSSFSIMVAKTLLDHDIVVKKYVEEMDRVRKYVTDVFSCKNIATTDSKIHFVTAELGKVMNVDYFRDFLMEKRYMIRRPFGMQQFSNWVRIGLLPMEQMKEFMKLLDDFLEGNQK